MKHNLEFEPRAKFFLDYTTMILALPAEAEVRELIRKGIQELVLSAAFHNIKPDVQKDLMKEADRAIGNKSIVKVP